MRRATEFWRDGRVADKTAEGCRRTSAHRDGGPLGVRDAVPNNRAPDMVRRTIGAPSKKFWRDGRVADKTAEGCRRTPAHCDGGPFRGEDAVPNNRTDMVRRTIGAPSKEFWRDGRVAEGAPC